ncbi:methyltransferase, partial [Acinetobacter baumannii]|nr:methyltransferase [Acinetobacter baumannii]
LGRAADVLSAIDPQSIEPFDFIFIDADKQGYPEYLELSLKFSKSGTIIVLDNVIRAGDILNPENKKPSIEGIRETFKALENHPQILSCTA